MLMNLPALKEKLEDHQKSIIVAKALGTMDRLKQEVNI